MTATSRLVALTMTSSMTASSSWAATLNDAGKANDATIAPSEILFTYSPLTVLDRMTLIF